MGFAIALLISHFALVFMTIVNAVVANNNASRVLSIVSAVCWTLLFVGDIVKLIQM